MRYVLVLLYRWSPPVHRPTCLLSDTIDTIIVITHYRYIFCCIYNLNVFKLQNYKTLTSLHNHSRWKSDQNPITTTYTYCRSTARYLSNYRGKCMQQFDYSIMHKITKNPSLSNSTI